MKHIYVSGPMTGIPEHNFPAFNAETARLRSLGYTVSNPVEINPDVGTPWHECLRADIRAMMDCDTLALLPGWEMSAGANLELHIAHRVAMTIIASHQIQERATP